MSLDISIQGLTNLLLHRCKLSICQSSMKSNVEHNFYTRCSSLSLTTLMEHFWLLKAMPSVKEGKPECEREVTGPAVCWWSSGCAIGMWGTTPDNNWFMGSTVTERPVHQHESADLRGYHSATTVSSCVRVCKPGQEQIAPPFRLVDTLTFYASQYQTFKLILIV